MATKSRWDSPRLEIAVGAVVLGFFGFAQAAAIYVYFSGATNSPTSGLLIFFILGEPRSLLTV